MVLNPAKEATVVPVTAIDPVLDSPEHTLVDKPSNNQQECEVQDNSPKTSQDNQSGFIEKERIRKKWSWIVLSVAASCLPVALCLIHDSVVGFNTPGLKIDYFKDLTLVIAAVGANALNCALAAAGKIKSGLFSGLSAVVGFGLYCLFRPEENIDNMRLNILILACIILLSINAVIGYKIETEVPNKANQN